MRDKSSFISLKAKDGEVVIFEDNDKKNDLDNIKTSIIFIKNILLVDSLMHNLLSISKLCDRGFIISFKSSHCIITNSNDNGISL